MYKLIQLFAGNHFSRRENISHNVLSLHIFLPSFYLSATQAIKYPMKCVCGLQLKWLSFSFGTKHQRSEWSCTALWSNMSFFHDTQIVLLHVIKLHKEHWLFQSCWGVFVSSLSFSISSLDYLVSRQNDLPFIAMAENTSISVMLWAQLFKCSFCFGMCLYVNTWTCLTVSREELKLCRQNIESVLEQRENLEEKMEEQKAEDNRWVEQTATSLYYFILHNLCLFCVFYSAALQCFVHELSISFCVRSCRVKRSWRATSTRSWSNKSESEKKVVWQYGLALISIRGVWKSQPPSYI